ncbi:hypothetical protein AALP_AA7G110700 [Arabis alpina]|uniref:Uncharacterized protein n=1 Tax=Arabis alpina TaxID=50452 RepID=A0A087GHB6_ARAAL|nr:hypothetical protein AALP_AA7G110700 [Arabis alpina]
MKHRSAFCNNLVRFHHGFFDEGLFQDKAKNREVKRLDPGSISPWFLR